MSTSRNLPANAGPARRPLTPALERGVDGAADAYKQLLDNAAALGSRWILELGTGREEFYPIYPEVMRRAAAHAATLGIGISLKPHGGISLTARELIALCQQVDHPAFAVSYDPGNIIYYTKGAVRPEDEVEQITSRTSTLIIKDCALYGDKADVMVTAGDGLVDFSFAIGTLREGGFRGPMYVECVGSTEPDEVDADLKRTHAYIAAMIPVSYTHLTLPTNREV